MSYGCIGDKSTGKRKKISFDDIFDYDRNFINYTTTTPLVIIDDIKINETTPATTYFNALIRGIYKTIHKTNFPYRYNIQYDVNMALHDRTKICKYKNKCFTKTCKLIHPNGWTPELAEEIMGKISCFNFPCRKSNCGFHHTISNGRRFMS